MMPPSPQKSDKPRKRIPLADVEREAILNALAYCRQNQTKAAEMLGISTRTIARKLKQYGLA